MSASNIIDFFMRIDLNNSYYPLALQPLSVLFKTSQVSPGGTITLHDRGLKQPNFWIGILYQFY